MNLPIPEPIPLEVLEKELTPELFIRKTNFGNNHIYIFTHDQAPNLMKEVGRLREITFREAGGGTGKEYDIDEYDIAEIPYKQLIVWDPDAKEILGGYRFIYCNNCPKGSDGKIELATTGLFHFSERFINEYLPYTIELGRSFVQPHYQSTSTSRRGLYALDNLWDGLGTLVINYPDAKYFFGKVTMYLHYNREARDLLLYFMQKHFTDTENLVYPFKSLGYETDLDFLKNTFNGANYKEDYKILSQLIRKRNENIPPLINSYMNLSPTMKVFGTSLNDHFGDVEETGILITIEDVYNAKKERHVVTYQQGEEKF